MARQEGIEPPTHSLEGCCSIQLSYWRFVRDRPASHTGSSCQVGAPGFEPGTSCSQSRRDTRLRYAPHETPTIAGPHSTVNSRPRRALDGGRRIAWHRPALAQRLQQRSERAASMTHPLLLGHRRFAKRHTELVGEKMRIVTEALPARANGHDGPRHLAPHH